ncbi:hypothetical protein C8Q77DRAFT_1160982 [Trametes polyzona]|nr:hypothetical protein C8Q77DRAFT_1160982 [Trametes polyzona]
MTPQSPTLPLSVSAAVPAPPLSLPVAAFGLLGRKHSPKKARRASQPPPVGVYVPNPVKMFDRVVIHPVAWPEEALRWMGVPRTLPPTPALSTSSAAQPLPEGALSAATREAYGRIADTLKDGSVVSREDLATFVVEAFTSIAKAQDVFIYRRAKAYLSLGDLRVRMEPMHGFSGSGLAPVLAYVDEPFRKAQREKIVHWRATRKEGVEAVQDDDYVEVMDVALLLAMAQEHKRWGVPADANGNHTTRVMYPNRAGNGMIVLTATTPAETLSGLQLGEDTVKKVTYTRRVIDIVGADGCESSPLLQLVQSLVEEGGRLARKAPAPRWPIGPWAWTTHF